MSTLLVVRHGQASYGAADYDHLSSLGEEQSERLGKWLAGRSCQIDALYVGPAKRHRQTADGISRGARAAGLLLPDGKEDERLGEFPAFELFTMHTGTQLHEAAAAPEGPINSFESICDGWMHGTLDSGDLETAAEFEARVISSVADICAAECAGGTRGKTIMLVTSGGPKMMAMKSVLGLAAGKACELLWSIANASVCEFRFRDDALALSGFNRIAHLEREQVTYR
ncbi:MAG: histidine phosphatase family protein [Myxococcales bacterium]|nr:histidine phosphatase family protein [Myxococcales bacterium]